MEGRRIDEGRIELRRGIVSIPWPSRNALLEHLAQRNLLSDVRDAFEDAGTTRPVALTDPQRLALRNAIAHWTNELGGSYDDLPEGISDLHHALLEDRPHTQVEPESS